MIMKDSLFGQVYKVLSNAYFVKLGDKIVKCGARGVLKIKSDGISVGDYVTVSNNTINDVKQRTNHFIRPNVSNVDLVVAVFSPEPKPDYYLIDKLYINAVKENVDFILVVNKTDIDPNLIEDIQKEYDGLDIKIISVSAKNGQGIAELKSILKNKLAVLAGQSAAGKTSIVNAMFNLDLKVGDLSEKILRGKHTTTRSEIFEYEDIRIVDSPGFAVLDADVSLKDLPSCYPDYVKFSEECKFRGCSHVSEPNCKVKELVNIGTLSKERYDRYVEIYNDISKRRIIYEKN